MHIELSRRLPDGSTLRDHLQAGASASGVVDPRLTRRLPAWLQALWHAWLGMSSARPVGIGLAAVPWTEYVAWQARHRVTLRPWESETLTRMDRAAIAAASAAGG